MRPVTVERTGLQTIDISVPDRSGTFGQSHPVGLAQAIIRKDTQFHLGGIGGKHGKVRAFAIMDGTKFIGSA